MCGDGACPSWDRLSLESDKDAGLSVQNMSSMLARLQEFTFSGSVRAALAFQVGAEMARMGRFCQMGARKPCGGNSWPDHDHDITNVPESGLESFDEIMSCGCQCCLVCLRRNGQLPRDFQEKSAITKAQGAHEALNIDTCRRQLLNTHSGIHTWCPSNKQPIEHRLIPPNLC